MASHAASSVVAMPAWSGAHSRAVTRSSASPTMLSQIVAHSSAAPGPMEPSAFPLATSVSNAMRNSAAGHATLLVHDPAVRLQEKQLDDRRFAVGPGNESASEVGEPRAGGHRRSFGVLGELCRPTRGAAVEIVQERLLAREVAVNRPFSDPGAFGDLGRGGEMVALRGEQLERGARQPLVRVGTRRHRSRI